MDEHVHTNGIWELKGSHWTLPILVEIHDETALVRIPEIPLLPKQRAALENALSQLATGGTPDERNVPLMFLIENAKRSEFTNAEDVVSWNRQPPIGQNIPKEEGVDDFVGDWLVSTGFGISKASATAIYISICTHMLHWLVNRRRPVNLVFGTLDPFQYRKNWKEILLGKAWLRAAAGNLEDRTIYITSHPPKPGDMAQSEMLSYNKGVCNWTLEFTPSKWFHNHSNEVEEKRRQRMGRARYLVSVMRTIMSHAQRAQATYSTYLNEISPKIVEVPEFNSDDGGYFTTLKKDSRGEIHRPAKAFVLPPDLAAAVQASPVETENSEDTSLP